jgi:beta-lactamase regulating signal transducer with metallopeptidase domain
MTFLERLGENALPFLSVGFTTAWQGTVIALIAIAVVSRVRTIDASARGMMWWALIVATTLVPAAVTWPAAKRLAQPPDAVIVLEKRIVTADGEAPPPARFSLPPQHEIQAPTASPALRIPRDVAGMLAIAWMLLAGVLLLRVAVRVLAVVALKRRAPLADARIRELVNGISASCSVEVRVSSEVRAPVLAGYFHPAIILPAEALSLSERTLRHVFLHELAHLRRQDHWITLVLRCVGALGFAFPALRLIATRLELDREIACDEWAIAQGSGSPREYVESLLDVGAMAIADPMPRHAITPAMATQIRHRVERLIHRTGVVTRTPRRVAVGAIVLIVGGGGLAAGVAPPTAFSAPVKTSAAPTDTTAPVTASPEAPRAAPPMSRQQPARQRLPRGDSVGTLVALLASSDADVSANAAFQLSAFRAAALAAVPALIETLRDERVVQRKPGFTSIAWGPDDARDETTPAEEAGKALLYVGRSAHAAVEAAVATLDGAAQRRAQSLARLLKNFD